MESGIEVRHYARRTEKRVFDDGLTRPDDARVRAKISGRINRLAGRNFGNCTPLRQGLCEPGIERGPGYRVY
jgi:putative addiction module killer protein